jgi:hypothetical protein
MNRKNVISAFSGTYAEAREKFVDTAMRRGARLKTFELSGYRGALGERLFTDVAYLGSYDARNVLIVSSGTHGLEGFCGAGCQIAALRDDALMARVDGQDIGVLFIHAVNPYGFSYLTRTNQDNVDLNRNHIRFGDGVPENSTYSNLHPLLVPKHWPPTDTDDRALHEQIEQIGVAVYRAGLMYGQYSERDGLFYGGAGPTWNNGTIRTILREYAAGAKTVGWIDIHTGLGPYGHGEKIYIGSNALSEVRRVREWWGCDVAAPFEGDSITPGVNGAVQMAIFDELPDAEVAMIGLEFGTLPESEVLLALRALAWLRRNPDCSREKLGDIVRAARAAFYCDEELWKGMVWSQARVSLLQSLIALSK